MTGVAVICYWIDYWTDMKTMSFGIWLKIYIEFRLEL